MTDRQVILRANPELCYYVDERFRTATERKARSNAVRNKCDEVPQYELEAVCRRHGRRTFMLCGSHMEHIMWMIDGDEADPETGPWCSTYHGRNSHQIVAIIGAALL